MNDDNAAIYRFPGAQILKPKVSFVKDADGEIKRVVTLSFNVLDLSPADTMDFARAAILEHQADAHIQLWQPPLPQVGVQQGKLP